MFSRRDGILVAVGLVIFQGEHHGVVTAEKGKPEILKAELVLLAMGFLKPEHPEYPDNVFVCGDSANGASLVVRALFG